jgi:Ca2+-binding EF-hand superfamily protein
MIDSVDTDRNGSIEFSEFLTIIKASSTTEKTAKINKFFKDMTTGDLGSDGISFSMYV